jgi:hypothetical protein
VLLEACPDGAKEKDENGKLPLHWAQTGDIARMLLEVYPDGAKEKDEDGKLPLNIIAEWKHLEQSDHIELCRVAYNATGILCAQDVLVILRRALKKTESIYLTSVVVRKV